MALPSMSSAVLAARHSGIRELSNQATAPGVIRLEVGQPDFRTPAHIGEAAKRAIDEGWTQYTHTQGLMSLRERLAVKLDRVNGIATSPDGIVCGPGGVGVISAAIAALCNPGDEVLLPDPHWPNYEIMLAWAQASQVAYPCPPELGFMPDLERLEAAITPRAKVLIINSPNNPTGAVYPAATLLELGRIAERHGLWVISDECYDQIMLDGSPVAPGMAGAGTGDRVISAFTFSKTYAMTGWRLGYATSPERSVVDAITKVLESNSSCVSTVSQKAAEAALDGPQECVGEMVGAYRRRRGLVAELLREAGMLIATPEGAFYTMADISASGLGSRELAFRLLRERSVAVAPGTAFGETAGGAVRISLASADEDLREGVGRLCELVAELAGSA